MSFYTCVESHGSKILYRGVENGVRVQRAIPFNPTLFIPTKNKTEWRTLNGVRLEPIQPGSMYECREFIDKYKDVVGFEIYGQTDFVYQYIATEFPQDLSYDIRNIVIAYIDIETTCEDGFPQISNPSEQVIAITVRINDRSYVFGLGEFNIDDPNVRCQKYDNEKQLLEDFLFFWESHAPDIITGWNVRFFDIPYLYNRIVRVLGSDEVLKLSPFERIYEKTIQTSRGPQKCYEMVGVSTLDYYELYQKFTYSKQESYRLDYIASVELGERKLSYDEYDNLKEFYKNDFNKFVQYNFHDVELVYKLERKMKLIELVLAVAYSAKVNYDDVFSQVRTWDTIIYNELLKDKIVIPPKKTAIKEQQYEGAYVKEPILGMNDWIVSFDLNSLYPHLIMQYNLSPETKEDKSFLFVRNGLKPMDILEKNSKAVQYLELAKTHGISVAANGVGFTKTNQGFLPRLMEKMYAERKYYKELMLESEKEMVAIEEELKRRGII